MRFSIVVHLSKNKNQLVKESYIIYNKSNNEYLYISGVDTCINANTRTVFNTQSNFNRLTDPYNISFQRRLFSNKITVSLCDSANCRKSKEKLKSETFNPFFILIMENDNFRSHAQPVKFELFFADSLVISKLKFFPPVLRTSFSIPQTFYFKPLQ